MNALGFTLSDLYVFGGGPGVLNFTDALDTELSYFINACESNTCRGIVSVNEDGFAYSFIISDEFKDCNAGVTVSNQVICETVKHL